MTCRAMIFWGTLFATLSAAADRVHVAPPSSWVRTTTWPVATGISTTAPIAVVLQDQQFNLTSDGQEAYFENIIRVQSPQGLAMIGTITVPWKPDTETLTVHKLHLIRGDQTIDVLDSQAFTVVRRENALELAMLDGTLTAVIHPAGLQVGDMVNLAFSIKRREPILAGDSEQLVAGWPDTPVVRFQLRVRWPKTLPIRWQADPLIGKPTEKRQGEFVEITWTRDNVEPIAVPRGAPPRFAIRHLLQFSSFKTWERIAQRLAPLYDRAATLPADSPLHREIERIRAQYPQADARIAAALNLVQEQIRYVFLGMNDGALVPASADLTWSRRFGDCKAKTVLLLALLRELGVDAVPVAVNLQLGDALPSSLPLLAMFNHVLVRATLDGREYWLDGTRVGDRRLDQITPPAVHWGLPLVTFGTTLVRIMPAPLSEPAVDTTIHIDATRGVHIPAPIEIETLLRGDAATAFRLRIAQLNATERDHALRSFFSSYDSIDIDSVSSTQDVLTDAQRVTLRGRITMDWHTGWSMVEGTRLGFEANFARPANSPHDIPFVVSFPEFVRSRHTIRLPQRGEHFKLSGTDIDTLIAGVEYRRTARLENGALHVATSTRSVTWEFPAQEAPAAQQALRKLYQNILYLGTTADYRLTDAEWAAELEKTFNTAADYIRRGNLALDRQEYQRAITDFDQALQLDPRSASALAHRGLAHAWLGNRRAAEQDLNAAEAMSPRNIVVAHGRGVLAMKSGDYAAAIAAFTTALEIKPDSFFALIWRARLEAQHGDRSRALTDTVAAIRLRPKSLEAYALQAQLLRMAGNLDQAAAVADSMIEANPDDARAHQTAAMIYAQLGKQSQALQHIDRALALDPSEQLYLLRAGYRPRSDRAARLADVEAALTINPRSTTALVLRAAIQADLGDYDGALRSIDTALATNDPTANLLTRRGIYREKNGMRKLAEQDFAAAFNKRPNHIELNSMCWDIATAGVALTTALRACDAALSQSPNYAAALDSRAFVLLRMNRYEEAIAAYTAALDIRPSAATSLFGRAIARLRRGESGAEDDLRQALAIAPQIAEEFAGYGVTP